MRSSIFASALCGSGCWGEGVAVDKRPKPHCNGKLHVPLSIPVEEFGESPLPDPCHAGEFALRNTACGKSPFQVVSEIFDIHVSIIFPQETFIKKNPLREFDRIFQEELHNGHGIFRKIFCLFEVEEGRARLAEKFC